MTTARTGTIFLFAGKAFQARSFSIESTDGAGRRCAMSREDYLKFRKAVLGNDALKDELDNKVKSKDDLISMANRLGYRFTVEDVSSVTELSDDELKSVSGGIGSIPTEKWVNVKPFDANVLSIYRRF